MSTGQPRLSKEYVIEAIMRDPATYLKADLIPDSENGGRPRLHQKWEYILYEELVSHFQTARKVETELGDPRTWSLVRELALELLPPELEPPAEPIRWHHFKYAKNTYLAREDIVETYRRLNRKAGCALAREAGNFPEGPTFSVHPTERNTITADGKVVATRSRAIPGQRRKDPKTGKRRKVKVEPGKAKYREGDGGVAWGRKFVPILARTEFGPVVLDIPYVAGVAPADEADVTVAALRELRPLLPGPLFHVHDGAMTGPHNQALLTELRTVLVNRPRAKENPKVKGRSIGKRKPDEAVVEHKVIPCPDGTDVQVIVHAVDGELGLMELTDTGERVFVPMLLTKAHSNENTSDGTYRPYAGLKLPAELTERTGRREVTVALYQTKADKRNGFPRAHHVRMMGPSNPDFGIYKRMRSYAESYNRTFEDSLYRHHRAHSEGWARQQVDFLGLAGLTNALTRERMRRHRLAVAA